MPLIEQVLESLGVSVKSQGQLGKIVAGHKPGRESPDEVTLFKATGLAIQDVGTAYKVYQLAKEKEIGATLSG